GVTVSGLTRTDILYGMAPLIASTPEPSSLVLLVLMIAAMMGYRLRATRRSASTPITSKL
ncbi:MAG: PEP-CTERM sorting domain-containing protein, partial [Bryobacteraceae bacterium]